MAEIICNTSPLQYLHMLGRLDLLPRLCGVVRVPRAVQHELEQGISHGLDLPDLPKLSWVELCDPRSAPKLPSAAYLGSGESAVLALAIQSNDPIVILDDLLARRVAEQLGIRLTGTLGILLDAKSKGLIESVKPLLDGLDRLNFRISAGTRREVLRLAGES